MNRGVQKLGEVFASVDWFVPPYVQLGVLRRLATKIEVEPEPEKKHGILDAEITRIYNTADLAVMLLETYDKTPIVADFRHVIADCIEAAHLGLVHVSVSGLVPVLEGVLRKLALERGSDVGMGTKKLVDEVDALKAAEVRRGGFGERLDMLDAFKRFLEEKFLKSTTAFVGAAELNRHGILHGVFISYGTLANFCRLISFLDLLCFFVALSKGGSVLAPDHTADSRRLAIYYEVLGVLRGGLGLARLASPC